MRNLVLLMITAVPFFTFTQVGGDIRHDGRELVGHPSFELDADHDGVIVFRIAVNAEGIITSAKPIADSTTIRSTPAKINARNYLSNFSFEPGTWYPKYHQGTIRLRLVKKN